LTALAWGRGHRDSEASQPAVRVAIHELDSTTTTCGYDTDTGVLEPFDVLPSIPSDLTGDDTGAEIVVMVEAGSPVSIVFARLAVR
jgi:hypothetical protein